MKKLIIIFEEIRVFLSVMAGKQAKTLSEKQIQVVLEHLEGTRNAARNKVMFWLSLNGLRAKEIASLKIAMIVNSDWALSNKIVLTDAASKGKSGREIPMLPMLREALKELLLFYRARYGIREDGKFNFRSDYVVFTERSERFSANAVAVFFKRLYQNLGMVETSSHSGRRTFITNAAKKISGAGGSLKDVMAIAGHKHLSTTQRYIEYDVEAQSAVVKQLYSKVK